MSRFPFDARLVRERRRTLGMSQRVLARDIGLSTTTLELIETGEGQVQHLTLGQAQRLAESLAVPLAALLTPHRDERTPATAVGDTAADGALLGELLHQARRSNVEIGDVLSSLAWSRARYDAAEEALGLALNGTGLHLHRRPGYVGLQPDGSDPAVLDRFRQAESARIGVRRREAQLIREAMLGLVHRASPSGFAATSGVPTRAQGLASLIKAGLLVHLPRQDGVQLSDDLRYALDL